MSGMASGGDNSTKLRCQRIGCDLTYSEDENVEGCCQYHPGLPVFHDGTKQWSCCKARSYDFSLFLALPGCVRGRHTQEKPNTSQRAPQPGAKIGAPGSDATPQGGDHGRGAPPAPALGVGREQPRVEECKRCSLGLHCTQPHANPRASGSAVDGVRASAREPPKGQVPATPPPKWDLDAPRVCRHNGCGATYTERENGDAACSYHPGQPVFHDRKRGETADTTSPTEVSLVAML